MEAALALYSSAPAALIISETLRMSGRSTFGCSAHMLRNSAKLNFLHGRERRGASKVYKLSRRDERSAAQSRRKERVGCQREGNRKATLSFMPILVEARKTTLSFMSILVEAATLRSERATHPSLSMSKSRIVSRTILSTCGRKSAEGQRHRGRRCGDRERCHRAARQQGGGSGAVAGSCTHRALRDGDGVLGEGGREQEFEICRGNVAALFRVVERECICDRRGGRHGQQRSERWASTPKHHARQINALLSRPKECKTRQRIPDSSFSPPLLSRGFSISESIHERPLQ